MSVLIISCAELIEAGAGPSGSYGCSGVDEAFLYAALQRHGIKFAVTSWRDFAAQDEGGSPFLAVIIRTPWDYINHVPEYLAFLHKLRESAPPLPVFNDPRFHVATIHKSYLHRLHLSAKIPTIPTELLVAATQLDVAEVVLRQGWVGSGLLAKPCMASGSRGCFRVRSGGPDDLRAMQDYLASCVCCSCGTSEPALCKCALRDMMLQPYLDSVEACGELSVIIIDGVLSHAVEKRPVEGDYRTQEEHGGVSRRVELTPMEEALVWDVVRATEADTARYCLNDGMAAPALPPLLFARIDFLRVTRALSEELTPSKTPLLLLEVEIIDPSLFFADSPTIIATDGEGGDGEAAGGVEGGAAAVDRRVCRAADALAVAIQKRLVQANTRAA